MTGHEHSFNVGVVVEVCAHLLRREVVQLDKQQEVDELSVLGAVGGVKGAELQIVELTELNGQRPLLSRLVGRPENTFNDVSKDEIERIRA